MMTTVYQLVARGRRQSLDCSGELRSGVFLSRASAERGIPAFKVACTTSKNKAQELSTLCLDDLRVDIIELPVRDAPNLLAAAPALLEALREALNALEHLNGNMPYLDLDGLIGDSEAAIAQATQQGLSG